MPQPSGLSERKICEHFTRGKDGTAGFSAMWQADRRKIQRMAPLGYIGRYMIRSCHHNAPSTGEGANGGPSH